MTQPPEPPGPQAEPSSAERCVSGPPPACTWLAPGRRGVASQRVLGVLGAHLSAIVPPLQRLRGPCRLAARCGTDARRAAGLDHLLSPDLHDTQIPHRQPASRRGPPVQSHARPPPAPAELMRAAVNCSPALDIHPSA
ncbi:hypothetical protein ACCO45_000349 [Purpureocillium lilacinum]|uniref:Uncharacterized protein n=1 Tax=Purpureocillium lilacinum TaxID=33203 RepID=A0ACC4E3Y3_PURLI